MRMNVLKWLQQVQSFAQQNSDAEFTAEALLPSFMLLPGEFRDLLLKNSLPAVLAGLVRWMPRPLLDQLSSSVTTNPQMGQWLTTFLEALQGDDEEGVPTDQLDDVVEEPEEPPFEAPDNPFLESDMAEAAKTFAPYPPTGPEVFEEEEPEHGDPPPPITKTPPAAL